MISYMLSVFSVGVLRTECDNVEILIYLVLYGYNPEISASKLSRFPPPTCCKPLNPSIDIHTFPRDRQTLFFPSSRLEPFINSIRSTTCTTYVWSTSYIGGEEPKHISFSIRAPAFSEVETSAHIRLHTYNILRGLRLIPHIIEIKHPDNNNPLNFIYPQSSVR